MKPVLRVAEMQAVDRHALRTVSEDTLVERAGTAVATWALRLVGGAYGRRVVVVAGKGNNGADGRVAADRLRRRGARVTVVEAAEAPARIGWPVPVDLVIDAAYGTGFKGEYRAPQVPSGVPVLAVDIPSGVDGDTGEACGEPLRADLTVTFAAYKTGLLQGDGPSLAGQVAVADIGLDCSAARAWVVEDDDVRRCVAPRPRRAHKWQSAVAVVAGSPGMAGAAGLSARAAYRAGAGMVRLGVPGGDPAEVPVEEAVGRRLPAQGWAPEALAMAERCRALVVGPGLGRAAPTAEDVHALLAGARAPVVVDADGLYALGEGGDTVAAAVGAWSGEVGDHAEELGAGGGRTPAGVVLTPHDGEFARLRGVAPGPDRFADTVELAARSGAVVLRKGPATIVARPDGPVLVATAGSARLATAGTGDVLSGIIGAFVARGVAPFSAAALAAHVHGRAAELGRAEGLVAGDLPDLVAAWLSTTLRRR